MLFWKCRVSMLTRSVAKEALLLPTCGNSILFSTGSGSGSGAGSCHSQPASDYCVDLVKSADFDNYLCGLLMPKPAKRAFFAIRAFNVEIAQIRDHSNNNFLTGRIRFQYWRDSIDKIYCSSSNSNISDIGLQPVLQELKHCIKQHNLTRRYFERCIEARLEDFATTNAGTGSYQSLSELENYAESSQSSLLYLLLEALGAVPTGEGQDVIESLKDNIAARAASHVGCSFGLMTLLRAFPYHLSQGHVYIPEDMMLKHGINAKILTDRRISAILNDPEIEKGLSAAIFDVACQAKGHLDEARKLLSMKTLPTTVRLALLPAVRTNMYLNALQDEQFNPLASRFLNNNPGNDQLTYQFNLLKAIYLSKI